jgi:4-hydroxythreonine-4-phosphate dehydrogenase
MGIRSATSISEAAFRFGAIDCLDLDLLPSVLPPFGHISAAAGDAAFHYLKRAIELALGNHIDAIATAPINKEALHLAGHLYPGHTEILAALTDTKVFGMMLSAPSLKVILVTVHVGLLDAIALIEQERVYATIRLAHEALEKAGDSGPRIAVCGLNPHAGENGMFGNREEEERIAPAVQRARREGLSVSGPFPADTLFYRATRGEFDIVVAMYHDQGLIPIKTLGLDAGVNVTVGLPIIRTSVDHGTAFAIAGKGIADARNMGEAIRQAAQMASRR